MRKFLQLSLTAVAAAAVLTSCGCYNKMMKKAAEGITVSTAPELVTLKGDNAICKVTVNVPAKAFHKQGMIKLTPVLVSAIDGSEAFGEPVFAQGEKVQDNYPVISYSEGGQLTFDVSIPYNPALRLSTLQIRAEVKCLKGGRIREFTPYDECFNIALGVDGLQLMADNYAQVAIAPDAFQRVTTVSESAQIMFVINQANVRPAQLTKEDVKALEKFIIDNTGDAKKTVGSVYTQAYASPDGPTPLNDRLAKDRGAQTQKAVGNKFSGDKVKGAKFDVNAMGEDWEGFKELVQQSNIQDKELILQVLNMYQDPQVREREIKNMSQAYTVLADKILPELRRSKMTVPVQIQGLTDDELRAAVANNISSLKLEEQLFAATLYTDNATKLKIYKQAAQQYNCYRAYNNAGVVLANMGKYDEAKQMFSKAASLNNTDPAVINNMGVVALAEGKKADALKFFNASSAPEAKANKGLVALAQGNYAEASRSLSGFNGALATYLNGDVVSAKQQLAQMDTWRANYVKAVIAAKEGNGEALHSNLRKAIQQNPDAEWLAATEVNFYEYFANNTFLEYVKVTAKGSKVKVVW